MAFALKITTVFVTIICVAGGVRGYELLHTYQQDLEKRFELSRNSVIARKLISTAFQNEDFATVIRVTRYLYSEEDISAPDRLVEIKALRYSHQLEKCIKKIREFITLYPENNATGPLKSQLSIAEKSHSLAHPGNATEAAKPVMKGIVEFYHMNAKGFTALTTNNSFILLSDSMSSIPLEKLNWPWPEIYRKKFDNDNRETMSIH